MASARLDSPLPDSLGFLSTGPTRGAEEEEDRAGNAEDQGMINIALMSISESIKTSKHWTNWGFNIHKVSSEQNRKTSRISP